MKKYLFRKMSDLSVGPNSGVKVTFAVSNSLAIDTPIVVSDPEMNDDPSVVSNSAASVPVATILNSGINVPIVVSNPAASTSNLVFNTLPVKKRKKKKPKVKVPSCFRHCLQI